ncbi:hypothetical protein ACFTWH_13470 [Streptomyces sp. NPDC057011]|uniref:hypothetical protein n=1 Tax=unclassified Streptomyces TaxID=2593676 RepID=UPI0036404CFC
MRTHDDDTEGTGPALTTEDLAHPDRAGDGETARETAGETAGEREEGTEANVPVYPGEATGAAMPGDEDATGNGEESEARAPVQQDEGGEEQPLLATGEAERYRTAWSEIQVRFVDDPREAVTSADALVAEVMQNLAGTFASHKQELEGQWQSGEHVATEDLRLALQHYRSFFNRLLKT